MLDGLRALSRVRLSLVLEMAGLGAVIAGVAVIWWPAALIVGGVAAVILAQGVSR